MTNNPIQISAKERSSPKRRPGPRVGEKVTELSLKGSEIRYRRLFEAAQDGIIILDASTEAVIDVNPFLIKLLGYSLDEFIGKKLWEVGAFKDIEASQQAFKALQKKKYIRYNDLPLKSKSGKLFQVEFVSNVYTADNKKVIQCNIRDITERRRVEKERQESDRRFREMLENIELIAVMLNSEGIVTFCNDHLLRLTGRSRVDVLGQNWFALFTPSELGLEDSFRAGIEHGALVPHLENEILTTSGERRLVAWNYTVLRDTEGRVIGVTAIGEDITERKRSEEAVLLSEAKFRSFIESAPLGVFVADNSGRYVDVNVAATEMLGYTEPELLHLSIPDILAPQSLEAGLQHFQRTVQEGFANGEFQFRRKDGTQFWATVISVRLREGLFMAYCQDITERKQTETRFNEQILELQRWHKATLSREGRIIELKREVNDLLGKAGQPPCYTSVISQVEKEK